MGFVYFEYRSRRIGVDLELYHAVLARKTNRWTDTYPDDMLIMNVGRSWRIGPEPEYLKAFYTPRHGIERLAEWTRVWRSGEADLMEAQQRLTGRVDVAGCFEPLTEPVMADGGPYYIEFFNSAGVRARDAVIEFYKERQKKHPHFTLHMLIDRIGKLGPDPRGIAAWGIGDYGNLGQIATELDDVDEPVRLVESGLYDDLGKEIL